MFGYCGSPASGGNFINVLRPSGCATDKKKRRTPRGPPPTGGATSTRAWSPAEATARPTSTTRCGPSSRRGGDETTTGRFRRHPADADATRPPRSRAVPARSTPFLLPAISLALTALLTGCASDRRSTPGEVRIVTEDVARFYETVARAPRDATAEQITALLREDYFGRGTPGLTDRSPRIESRVARSHLRPRSITTPCATASRRSATSAVNSAGRLSGSRAYHDRLQCMWSSAHELRRDDGRTHPAHRRRDVRTDRAFLRTDDWARGHRAPSDLGRSSTDHSIGQAVTIRYAWAVREACGAMPPSARPGTTTSRRLILNSLAGLLLDTGAFRKSTRKHHAVRTFPNLASASDMQALAGSRQGGRRSRVDRGAFLREAPIENADGSGIQKVRTSTVALEHLAEGCPMDSTGRPSVQVLVADQKARASPRDQRDLVVPAGVGGMGADAHPVRHQGHGPDRRSRSRRPDAPGVGLGWRACATEGRRRTRTGRAFQARSVGRAWVWFRSLWVVRSGQRRGSAMFPVSAGNWAPSAWGDHRDGAREPAVAVSFTLFRVTRPISSMRSSRVRGRRSCGSPAAGRRPSRDDSPLSEVDCMRRCAVESLWSMPC